MTLSFYADDSLAVNSVMRLQRPMGQRGRPPKIPVDQRPAWVQRLIAARERRGWTQEKLGAEAGLPQTTVAGYESGSTEPDIAKLELLAKALGVDPGFVAFGDPDQQDAPLGAIIERHKKDKAFQATFLRTAAMLGEEGINADMHATVQTALRLLETVNSGSDIRSIKERVEAAVSAERLRLRDILIAALQKDRT